MSVQTTVFVAIGALGMGACQLDMDVLVASGEVEEACITAVELPVPAIPTDNVAHEITRDVSLGLPVEFVTDLRLVGIGITGKDIEGFGFLRSVRVSVSGMEMPRLTLIDAHMLSNSDSYVFLEGNRDLDITHYVGDEQISLDMQFNGALPKHSWKVSADVCFSVSGEYRVSL